MALLASFAHRHQAVVPEVELTCSACVHHLPHTGHISPSETGLADCVLCHFPVLPCLFTLLTLALTALEGKRIGVQFSVFAPHGAALRSHPGRAPPFAV